ncbi:MAG: ATP-binding cassette domain-containing protein [Pseudomonadota bacterium]
MILLDRATVLRPGGGDPILLDASLLIRPMERVGILAASGSGKTMLARLLAGIEAPDRGSVRLEGRVSWPIGAAGFLHPDERAEDAIATLARLTGTDVGAMAAFCAAFCGLPDGLSMPVKHLTPVQRATLAFAASMAVDCNHYIADETVSVGNGAVLERSRAVLEDRLTRAGLVLISRNPRRLGEYCDRLLVLIRGCLVPCPDPEAGQAALDLAARSPETVP